MREFICDVQRVTQHPRFILWLGTLLTAVILVLPTANEYAVCMREDMIARIVDRLQDPQRALRGAVSAIGREHISDFQDRCAYAKAALDLADDRARSLRSRPAVLAAMSSR